tara:strand:+ start:342 stop:572 length:231 start_codon:yes stop_codon:yes gene_type:complete
MSLSAFANNRDNSIEAAVPFIGNQELASFGYSKELSNTIVTGDGFSLAVEIKAAKRTFKRKGITRKSSKEPVKSSY